MAGLSCFGLRIGMASAVWFAQISLAQAGTSQAPVQDHSPTQNQVQAPKVPPDPVLIKRPQKVAVPGVSAHEGSMRLDVVVTGANGKPVAGLSQKDFTVLDQGRAQAIVSFRAMEGHLAAKDSPVTGNAASGSDEEPGRDPAVAVVLIVDAANTPLNEFVTTRNEIERFLRQGGGHLTNPVSIALLSDLGLKVAAASSSDGNMLADAVHRIQPSVHRITEAQGAQGAGERLQLSVRALASIVNSEVKAPGRKLIVWTGHGWPTLSGEDTIYNARSHALNFVSIISLVNGLRESRTEVCSAGGGSEFFHEQFLKGVRTEKQANSGNLALQVLAVESGGKTLDPGNGSHLAGQLGDCMADAGPYYSLTYEPPAAAQATEYHEIKVQMGRPGLKARTSSGYYGRPPDRP